MASTELALQSAIKTSIFGVISGISDANSASKTASSEVSQPMDRSCADGVGASLSFKSSMGLWHSTLTHVHGWALLSSPARREFSEFSSYVRSLNLDSPFSKLTAMPEFAVLSNPKPWVFIGINLLSVIIVVKTQSKLTATLWHTFNFIGRHFPSTLRCIARVRCELTTKSLQHPLAFKCIFQSARLTRMSIKGFVRSPISKAFRAGSLSSNT